MAQVTHVHRLDLVLAPAEQLAPGRIDADEIALEIADAEQVLGHVPDAVALAGARLHFRFELLLERTQLAFGLLARLLGLHALDRKAQPPRDVERQIDFLARKNVRRRVVGHDLAGEAARRR